MRPRHRPGEQIEQVRHDRAPRPGGPADGGHQVCVGEVVHDCAPRVAVRPSSPVWLSRRCRRAGCGDRWPVGPSSTSTVAGRSAVPRRGAAGDAMAAPAIRTISRPATWTATPAGRSSSAIRAAPSSIPAGRQGDQCQRRQTCGGDSAVPRGPSCDGGEQRDPASGEAPAQRPHVERANAAASSGTLHSTSASAPSAVATATRSPRRRVVSIGPRDGPPTSRSTASSAEVSSVNAPNSTNHAQADNRPRSNWSRRAIDTTSTEPDSTTAPRPGPAPPDRHRRGTDHQSLVPSGRRLGAGHAIHRRVHRRSPQDLNEFAPVKQAPLPVSRRRTVTTQAVRISLLPRAAQVSTPFSYSPPGCWWPLLRGWFLADLSLPRL